jgi:hypothetical protein
MAQPTIQTSFASGEWAPKLRSRVDIQKYHVGAELLRNFYVDYSGGGASTRPGTRFIAAAKNGVSPTRLVPFQPSSSLSYVLEFGDGYIRFYSNGAQVQVSPGVPYEIGSPFAATDLFPNPLTGNPGIKFVQDVTSMIICHPSYQPQILTINSATNWTISTINFGATVDTPSGLSLVTTLTTAASNWNYAYTVTAVDVNGQESIAATPATLTGYKSLNDSTAPGTNTLSWSATTGAISYNVYKASPTFNVAIPTDAPMGFIGNTFATSFNDATPGIGADFSQSPPVAQNPFQGAGVVSYAVTTAGTYTVVPAVSVAAPPAGGFPATAIASLGVISDTVSNFGNMNTQGTNPQGSYLTFPDGVTFLITSASWNGFAQNGQWGFTINAMTLANPGSITGVGVSVPSNPVGANGCSVPGFLFFNSHPSVNLTWGVTQVLAVQKGAGYPTPPAVTFSSGAAVATANLGGTAGGNPGAPGFIQERLVLAGLQKAVQSVDLSQPGSFFNFNTSFPSEASDAVNATIVAEDLNDIRSVLAVPTGLLMLTGKGAWLLNGGGGLSTATPITPTSVQAQPQSFTGANDMPPLKVNYDALYVTNKGNYVRDLNYNIYVGIFTGSDISVLSNHLFFNHYLVSWCWSEEPFKTVWAVRDDGQLLSLAYVKEQDLIGWAHHDTNGQFKSVCSVIETVNGNTVDAVYVVVQRFINGSFVQYVERMADRFFTYGAEDSWSVDCGLQTAPAVSDNTPLLFTGDGSAIGNTLTLTDTDITAPFTAAMATQNWVVRANGGMYKITGFTSTNVVTAVVVRVPPQLNPYTNTPYPAVNGYTIWQPVTTVSGLTQLAGQSVVGVADGVAIGPLTVSGGGSVTLPQAATKVTLGLSFTPQLKTLRLDLGQPTVQSKRKKLPSAMLRVADTLGLQMGTSFANAVSLKDLTLGNHNIADNTTITDLYSGDAFVILDQLWQEPGQLCIQQNLPYPATILGVMPQVAVGDTRSVKE